VVIRDAAAAELPVLQDIDVATGQMFRDIGMPEVAEYDPWPLPDLEHSRAVRDQAAGGRDRPGPVAAGVHAPRRPWLVITRLGITPPRAA
jgi:hypothetical protein